jgi:hypothetical protein
MLSSQPPPEYWCSIAYFELDTQVSDAHTQLHAPLFFADQSQIEMPENALSGYYHDGGNDLCQKSDLDYSCCRRFKFQEVLVSLT